MNNIRKEENGFSKDHTLILKGILVFMLLFHHLFYPDEFEKHAVNTLIKDPELLFSLVMWCKICVAGFCFITAYGMTRKFMGLRDKEPGRYAEVAAVRLIKLEMAVWFIYIPAVLYRKIIMDMLLEYGNNGVQKVIYMLLDMCGLAKYAGTPMINVTWWYLSLSILLILTMPLIYFAYSRWRYLLLAPACLLPAVIFTRTDVLFSDLLPVVLLGTAFAYENWFERIKQWNNNAWRRLFLFAALLLCGWLSFEINRYVNYSLSWMLILFLPLLVQEYICYVPGLSHALKFIGTYATNIFLVHTFIYYYFYADVIYALYDSWKIYAAVFTLSLIVSVAAESAKKLLRYGRLVDFVCKKLCRQ